LKKEINFNDSKITIPEVIEGRNFTFTSKNGYILTENASDDTLTPLVEINRFIDSPPKSRNEKIAILMHQFDLCELRGSGIDRVIEAVEKAILPAPKFIKGDFYTKVIIYPKKTFAQMTKDDRIRACYQHCCLKYMENEKMTNQTFRERMGIEEKNYSMASRIIKEVVNTGLIKEYTPENKSRKFTSYIPYWG
jgi:predicted HTH transcriptional regulator